MLLGTLCSLPTFSILALAGVLKFNRNIPFLASHYPDTPWDWQWDWHIDLADTMRNDTKTIRIRIRLCRSTTRTGACRSPGVVAVVEGVERLEFKGMVFEGNGIQCAWFFKVTVLDHLVGLRSLKPPSRVTGWNLQKVTN